MSIVNKILLAISISFWMSVQAWAVEVKKAMVVSSTGTVEIFSSLKTETEAQGKSFVIFDGQKYISRRVQTGVMVFPNDILRTGNDGKLKIIYNNGDVFILGPATAFTVPAVLEKESTGASSELIYGKVRAMIDKKGPNSGLKIKTKAIVMGIRGTDLFMSFNPLMANSQVHVLRGEVQVQPNKPSVDPAKETIFVKTGQKGVGETSGIKLAASTQTELKKIQDSTTTPPPALKDLKEEEKAQVEKLIAVSKEKVLEDIKTTTPEVYKSLQAKKADTIETISQVMVEDLSKTAPKGSSKPKLSDFEKSEDVYDKYFKPAQ